MTTVRISEKAHQILKDLSSNRNESMQSILDKALEEYRRQMFLEKANQAFAALRKNPKAWKEEKKEREAWDATLEDGLEKS